MPSVVYVQLTLPSSVLQVTVLMGVGDASLNMWSNGAGPKTLQGNIELNPLSKNTEVYCCTPIYRFILLPHGG